MADTEADSLRAEAILYALAAELRRVPLDDRTTRLHVRALEMKREVARWGETRPDEAARRSAIDEMLALHDEAKARRRMGAAIPGVRTSKV